MAMAQLQQDPLGCKSQSARDLEAFVYAVSHDMSAPIRAVSGFSRLILDRASQDFDEKTREQFGYIIRAGEEMQAMLSALTEYSRLTTRPNPPTAAPAAEVVAMATQGFCEQIAACGGSVEADIEEGLMLHGDISRLMRFFECLIANALLYRKKDVSPKVTITGWQDAGKVHFSVADNGIGMAQGPEIRERIFRPFGRLHRPEDYPGIGMGLTIAHKIAQMHEGEIDVDATPEVGSCFLLTLPQEKRG